MSKIIYSNAKELYEIYYNLYRPPPQSLELTSKNYFNHISKYTFVYHYNDDLQKVRIITEQREPVNIEMNKYFDTYKMIEKFGYNKSGYSSLFSKNNKKLPPLIGIHCLCPVYFDNNSKPEGDIRVHVINSIGIALDTTKQPDYKYFLNNNFLGIIERLAKSYNIVWKCANQFKLNRVILCKLGGGYFCNNFPGNYLEDLFIPALIQSLNNNINNLPKIIGIMDTDNNTSEIIKKIVNEHGCDFECVGRIPDILYDENTLYQNAWDPHSMVGNGNSGDNSLDGFFGRYTGMHFLCWPPTNPNIKYIQLV